MREIVFGKSGKTENSWFLFVSNQLQFLVIGKNRIFYIRPEVYILKNTIVVGGMRIRIFFLSYPDPDQLKKSFSRLILKPPPQKKCLELSDSLRKVPKNWCGGGAVGSLTSRKVNYRNRRKTILKNGIIKGKKKNQTFSQGLRTSRHVYDRRGKNYGL